MLECDLVNWLNYKLSKSDRHNIKSLKWAKIKEKEYKVLKQFNLKRIKFLKTSKKE